MESWRDRILEAARNQEYVEKVDETTTRKVPLDEATGIDILGNIVEACQLLSVNYEYYGKLLTFNNFALLMLRNPQEIFIIMDIR